MTHHDPAAPPPARDGLREAAQRVLDDASFLGRWKSGHSHTSSGGWAFSEGTHYRVSGETLYALRAALAAGQAGILDKPACESCTLCDEHFQQVEVKANELWAKVRARAEALRAAEEALDDIAAYGADRWKTLDSDDAYAMRDLATDALARLRAAGGGAGWETT